MVCQLTSVPCCVFVVIWKTKPKSQTSEKCITISVQCYIKLMQTEIDVLIMLKTGAFSADSLHVTQMTFWCYYHFILTVVFYSKINCMNDSSIDVVGQETFCWCDTGSPSRISHCIVLSPQQNSFFYPSGVFQLHLLHHPIITIIKQRTMSKKGV